MEFEIIRFTKEDLEITVQVSLEDKSVWLTQEQMVLLFRRSRSSISKHIKHILSEEGLDIKRAVSINATTALDGKVYETNYYNLDVIMSVGRRTKSPNTLLFYEWAKQITQALCQDETVFKSNIVRFEQEDISLDVSIKPEEETVYLSKDQLIVCVPNSLKYLSFASLYSLLNASSLPECSSAR